MGDREYIDIKFDEFRKGWRTDLWKIVAILIAVLGSIWGSILYQGTKIRDIEFDIAILDARTQELQYRTGWMLELGELQRDLLKGISEGKEVDEFIDRLGKIEQRVWNNSNPMPTLRSAKK